MVCRQTHKLLAWWFPIQIIIMVWMHEAQSPKITMHDRDKNNILSDNYLGQKQWAYSRGIEYRWLTIMLAQKKILIKAITGIRINGAKHGSGPVPQICYILCAKTERTRKRSFGSQNFSHKVLGLWFYVSNFLKTTLSHMYEKL